MKWVKAPDELKELLEEAMKDTECEKRSMFGYPAYFISKNMFIGLFQDKIFARLSDHQLVSLRSKFPHIANFEPMPGRPMKSYYVVPEELYRDLRTFKNVIQGAAEHARLLEPKVKKSRRK
jgi:TfoX/Sxy family transcriptional regulator of competence genes